MVKGTLFQYFFPFDLHLKILKRHEVAKLITMCYFYGVWESVKKT